MYWTILEPCVHNRNGLNSIISIRLNGNMYCISIPFLCTVTDFVQCISELPLIQCNYCLDFPNSIIDPPLSPHLSQGQPTPPHGTQAAQGEEFKAAESSQQGYF